MQQADRRTAGQNLQKIEEYYSARGLLSWSATSSDIHSTLSQTPWISFQNKLTSLGDGVNVKMIRSVRNILEDLNKRWG